MKADLLPFIPQNDLERALAQAQGGRMAMPDILDLFGQSEIFVPSGGEIAASGEGFRPLLFDRDGTAMVACFTAAERIGRHVQAAPYCLEVKGSAFLRNLAAEVGVVVNPGQEVGSSSRPPASPG